MNEHELRARERKAARIAAYLESINIGLESAKRAAQLKPTDDFWYFIARAAKVRPPSELTIRRVINIMETWTNARSTRKEFMNRVDQAIADPDHDPFAGLTEGEYTIHVRVERKR